MGKDKSSSTNSKLLTLANISIFFTKQIFQFCISSTLISTKINISCTIGLSLTTLDEVANIYQSIESNKQPAFLSAVSYSAIEYVLIHLKYTVFNLLASHQIH